jgi:hypothetical protein
MADDSEIDPVATVFSGGHRFFVGRSVKRSTSYFGGPGYDQVIDGARYGPRRIHHILTLNHNAFGISSLKFGFKTSFYYGLCFEGCELEWERTHTAAMRVTKIDPRKSGKEYPYFGYPDVLPYFPLEVRVKSAATSSDIEAAVYNTGWDVDPDKVYVIVHSHPDLGIALLNPDADVDLVFEYETASGRIRAVNQTD